VAVICLSRRRYKLVTEGMSIRPRVLVKTQGVTADSAAPINTDYIRTLPYIANALI
jgi:hypothetical protein